MGPAQMKHTAEQLEAGTEYPDGRLPDYPRRPAGSTRKQCLVCPVAGTGLAPGSSEGCSAYCKKRYRIQEATGKAVQAHNTPAPSQCSAVHNRLYWPSEACRRNHRTPEGKPAPRYISNRACVECLKIRRKARGK